MCNISHVLGNLTLFPGLFVNKDILSNESVIEDRLIPGVELVSCDSGAASHGTVHLSLS